MSNPVQITFDANDIARLAEFWADALGYVLQPPPDGFESWVQFLDERGIPEDERGQLAAIVDPAGVGPRILFQLVPEGKTAKNRVHLDVNTSDQSADRETRKSQVYAKVADLESKGAVRGEEFVVNGAHWVVMQDPEGNEFCVQ